MTDTTATELSELLTTAQLAEYLQVPVGTLAAWRYRRVGPRGIAIGRHIRYRRDDVLRFLAERSDPRREDG
jgi:excisionase family DNA binding protein